ncbi:hypothetical protein [Paenibacillus donghaensis]|uniref:Uncharacterized protein n=1 Tax=Paenibacillus donghaensis TaxID=414771 RepID=A0A2Z2KMM7_9BACL|nr:hypothetical protein [Paenibacillus donghaensis]ASA22452.1 hypothetical protein B9T62_17645 [Paenibacillus donghaensis]
MACVAQFGIVEIFEEDKDYSDYEPEKYNCVAIDDDYLNEWWEELTLLQTYSHSYSRPEFALARWGVTLIPPASLAAFYDIVAKDHRARTSQELLDLMTLLRQAISENKYVIHYGV